MNELAVKIAELLDITVESAVELYPVIRGQFMWYSVLGSVGDLNLFFALALVFASVIFGTYYFLEYNDSYDLTRARKTAKVIAIGWVIVVLIWITLIILTHITAPDIVLIKGLLH